MWKKIRWVSLAVCVLFVIITLCSMANVKAYPLEGEVGKMEIKGRTMEEVQREVETLGVL